MAYSSYITILFMLFQPINVVRDLCDCTPCKPPHHQIILDLSHIADDMSIEEFANSRYMRDGWVYVDGNDAEGRSIVVSDSHSCP
jgi:hypothetical protein